MENYEYYGNALYAFKRGLEEGVDYQDLFPTKQWDFQYMINRALTHYGKAIVFEIDDDLKKACALHKARAKRGHIFLPHNPMFIDVRFNQEEYGDKLKGSSIIGILLTESPLHSKEGSIAPVFTKQMEFDGAVGKAMNAMLVSFRDGKIWFDSATFNYEIYSGKKKKIEHLKVPDGSFIENFVNNILMFINDPEIQLIRVVRGEKNIKRRLKQGKMPLPNSIVVKLNGQLKTYVNDFANKVKHGTVGWHYNYRFPVRSHIRRYRDKTTLEVIKEIRINEYVKGSGPLINKRYEVINNEKE